MRRSDAYWTWNQSDLDAVCCFHKSCVHHQIAAHRFWNSYLSVVCSEKPPGPEVQLQQCREHLHERVNIFKVTENECTVISTLLTTSVCISDWFHFTWSDHRPFHLPFQMLFPSALNTCCTITFHLWAALTITTSLCLRSIKGNAKGVGEMANLQVVASKKAIKLGWTNHIYTQYQLFSFVDPWKYTFRVTQMFKP